MSQQWLWESASDLGRGIERGEIGAVELTETYLAAIEAHPLRDRIYARVTAERARAEGKAAAGRAKVGQRRSLLDGVPISWKDLFDTADIATEAGSAYLKDRVPTRDAEVLQNATEAGLVCLGKTHMSELAFSGLGYNPVTRTPPCVNDEGAVPGGSSSGAAASVAFGLAAAAIGSDTGGSVRIPSAWNDLVGLKTTHGLLSLEGVVPLCATFDTVGPLCRTTEDNAHVFAALAGEKPADLDGATLRGTRMLVLETIATEGLREEVETSFTTAIYDLKSAGVEITHGTFEPLREAFDLTACLFTVDAYARWKDVIEAQPELMFSEILERFRGGKAFSGTDYVQAWTSLQSIRAEYLTVTAGYDAILMPTAPIMPPNLERLINDHDYYVTENLLALRNTRIANLLGLAALTIPTKTKSSGLMLVGAPHSEAKLLRLGTVVEGLIR